MSGLAWIILDAALALTAVFGVVKVAVTPPPKPIPTAQLEIAENKAKNATSSKEVPKSVASLPTGTHPDALSPKASLDSLWKETLFLPGRMEAEPGDPAADAAASAAALAGANFEFELVGIAQISPAGQKATPVAILRSKQSSSRNGGRPQRGGPGRGGPPQRDSRAQAPQAPTATAPKPAEKLVFKEGDPINGTGYLIKAIYPEQRMVEVSRGNETIKLTINFASENANQRRNEATQEQAKKKQAAAEAEASRQASIREKQAQENAQRNTTNAANPGTPPPPPGTAGNANPANNGQYQQGQQGWRGRRNSGRPGQDGNSGQGGAPGQGGNSRQYGAPGQGDNSRQGGYPGQGGEPGDRQRGYGDRQRGGYRPGQGGNGEGQTPPNGTPQ